MVQKELDDFQSRVLDGTGERRHFVPCGERAGIRVVVEKPSDDVFVGTGLDGAPKMVHHGALRLSLCVYSR